ncbi:hypothetical protein MGYG_07042 [Nannizzia gypsea CBS 118893]|uniref:Uncharacterized protein n=1 Tax=Arthroderma gypseum (strain ATCC MYA-4604 / CBS 118893) TaxID=535722 RepID=E4V1X1_ARTGP|nr:hypothetical protein MGYG_07042 [Nannizzia gypsea CBS 118893]EFR04036.1 hypothetical protein MGYG_07042 [Nannizzia gypsea CBS 118893]
MKHELKMNPSRPGSSMHTMRQTSSHRDYWLFSPGDVWMAALLLASVHHPPDAGFAVPPGLHPRFDGDPSLCFAQASTRSHRTISNNNYQFLPSLSSVSAAIEQVGVTTPAKHIKQCLNVYTDTDPTARKPALVGHSVSLLSLILTAAIFSYTSTQNSESTVILQSTILRGQPAQERIARILN